MVVPAVFIHFNFNLFIFVNMFLMHSR